MFLIYLNHREGQAFQGGTPKCEGRRKPGVGGKPMTNLGVTRQRLLN